MSRRAGPLPCRCARGLPEPRHGLLRLLAVRAQEARLPCGRERPCNSDRIPTLDSGLRVSAAAAVDDMKQAGDASLVLAWSSVAWALRSLLTNVDLMLLRIGCAGWKGIFPRFGDPEMAEHCAQTSPDVVLRLDWVAVPRYGSRRISTLRCPTAPDLMASSRRAVPAESFASVDLPALLAGLYR